ncbi:MAG: hypothetical protein GC182_09495 [Rhodopseudomonas sp.]|nr:hypothetical protein [Rhodopseudomonas sp.]
MAEGAVADRVLAASRVWLGLAATPTFAAMAFVSSGHGDAMANGLCAMGSGGTPMSGMVTMYLLMGLFHVPPWLRLIGGA